MKKRKSEQEQIAEYSAQEEKIRNRRKKVERRVNDRERRADTRRKILVGAERLSRSERAPEERTALIKDMNAFLAKPKDRVLFSLPPRTELEQSEDASEAEPRSRASGERTDALTNKQADYLASLIRDNSDRAREIGIQLSQLATLTKEEASEMINRFRE